MRVKVGVLGAAGVVGSSSAFRLAEQGFVSEIVMIDTREKLVQSHALDILQAVSGLNGTVVRCGAWPDLAGCNIVVMAASVPGEGFKTGESIAKYMTLLRETAGQLAAHCPEAVVICASNPVDVLNYALYDLSGMEAGQFLGFSWNDALRLRFAVAEFLGAPVSEVGGMVLGEHGEGKVPLFDRITLRSKPVTLTAGQEKEIARAMEAWFSAFRGFSDGARTAGWTSAIGISKIAEAVVTESGELLPCSAVLRGEYGISGISLGVPVRLHSKGIREIVELPLTDAQRQALGAAAEKIRGMIDRLPS